MGHRANINQSPTTVQNAFKKAKISFTLYRGGALVEYQYMPDILLWAVTGQLTQCGWSYDKHKKTTKLLEAERCGIKRFINKLQSDDFLDFDFIETPEISPKQEEILRRQLKNLGWKYRVQSEVYRDGLGREYPLIDFDEPELALAANMVHEYRFADNWMDFYLKTAHAVKQYAKKDVGPNWYKHPLVLIYHDLKTNVRIRSGEVRAEESDMIVDEVPKKEWSLERMLRQSA